MSSTATADVDANPDDTTNEPAVTPISPIPRSESQLSQRAASSQRSVSALEGSAVSRRSSPTNRPDSTKSALSRDSSIALSLATNSATGKKSRTRGHVYAEVTDKHQITFTVTVAAAVPAVYDEESGNNKSKRVVSDPKPQAYYHVEYYLLPTDVDPSKTDITLFGIAAKIYPDKQDAKVMKTWTEGNRTWIAWAHSHVITVTSELLKKLCYHKIVVRVWDTKEKFGGKAKADRPRAFKFPSPKPGEDLDDISGVKTIISRLCKSFIRRLPKKAGERVLPQPNVNETKAKSKMVDSEATQNAGLPGTEAHPQTFKTDEVPCLLLGHPDIEFRIYSKLVELAKLQTQTLDKKLLKRSLDNQRSSPLPENKPPQTPPTHRMSAGDLISTSCTDTESEVDARRRKVRLPPLFDEQDPFNTSNKPRSQRSGTPASKVKRNPRDKKAEQLAKEAADYAKKHGVCSFHVSLAPLFVGQRMCVTRLETPVKNVLDGFVSVSVDKDLLTDEFKKELNPMSIKIKSVKNMPNEPVPFSTLREKCHPCSLSYDFFNRDTHKTKGIPHDKSLYWDDLNVVLLGTLPRSQLLEYLLGPPMEIQVHDRDKILTSSTANPALFGEDGEDEKINNVGYISGRRTQYNALKERPTSWDPYGIAKVSMSDLLLGQRVINLQIPVHSCPIPDILGRQTDKGRVLGIPGSVDGPSESPMSTGSYMDSHTMLKLRLEVAIPLVSPTEVEQKPLLPVAPECPFGRIVYILDHRHRAVAKSVLNLASEINAKGLGLDNLSPIVLDAALSTYKLSAEQQRSKQLDIVTGFQLMDGKNHVFVLEGLKESAICCLWNSVSKPREGVKIFYNSDLSFSERLYSSLDVDLTRVKLHQPLNLIVKQPLLYVRDMVPKNCFVALTKLDQLVQSPDMRTAVRNELFPTADQVISMSREFGVPLTADDLITDAEIQVAEEALATEKKSKSAVPANATSRSTRSRMQLKDPLDMSNVQYMEALKSRQMTADGTDYVHDNIRTVLLESRQNKLRKQYPPTQQSGQTLAHNYSTQTYNSTELARDMIRKNLDQNTLYTYNPEFHHSATFLPVNLKEIERDERIAHRSKFVSKKDWSYPGVGSLIQCNSHPKKPDPARTDALKQEWEENLNNRTKLNPTLEERDTYSWIDRELDLNNWSYPAKHFEPQPEAPKSIMLPGVHLEKELHDASRQEKEVWQRRVVVEDPSMYFYRCNPQTEAVQSGPKASNDLSRLENLRRDPPNKYSFAKMRSDIPPLRVVQYPGVDTTARNAGENVDRLNSQVMFTEKTEAFHPGPDKRHSWSVESNRVPTKQYNHADNGYFNLYHNTAHFQKISKKQITPLRDEEYAASYLFVDPVSGDKSRQRLGKIKLAQHSPSKTMLTQQLSGAVI